MTQSFKKELLAFFEHMLQNVSCHGGNWVKKCFNPKVKSLCIFVMVCFQTIVFVTIFWQLCHHHKDFSTSLQWSNEENLLYPNITICSPRLFDKEKVDSKYINICIFEDFFKTVNWFRTKIVWWTSWIHLFANLIPSSSQVMGWHYEKLQKLQVMFHLAD